MKYIVYKTTNVINNYIYIGVHLTKDPEVFDGYIGCGVYVTQKSTYMYPKTAFQSAVKEFGPKNFKREVLAILDSAEEAYLIEAQLVNEKFLARKDVYNMVLGGYEGSITSIKCYKYSTTTGEYLGEYISMQQAALQNNVCGGSVWNAIMFKTKSAGFYWSTEKLDKIDLDQYISFSKPVTVYRYLSTGEFDREFNSYTSAAKDSNCTIVEVSRSAKLGYRVKEYQFSYIKEDSYDKAKSIYLKTRPVFKYDQFGNFLEEYSTQKEAEYKNPGSNITKAIKNKKVDNNNFLWGLEKLEKYCCSTQTKKKKVRAYSLDGSFIKEWESGKACMEETGVTRNYIKVEKPYKGTIYKYVV